MTQLRMWIEGALIAVFFFIVTPIFADDVVKSSSLTASKELHVVADGSGDFSTLSQALGAALPGNVIVIHKPIGLVGMALDKSASGLVVIKLIPGSAAESAGIEPGTVIKEIDGFDTVGLTVEKAVARIRGPVGTQVSLKILPPNSTLARVIALIRGDTRYIVKNDVDKFRVALGELDYESAFRWGIPLAKGGDPETQYSLGNMYADGEGVGKNLIEALKWYLMAAGQGQANAQYNLGLMYEDGEGVEKDPIEAIKWYRKAADQGSASAQTNLAAMYYNGKGVKKDHVEAIKWLRKLAESGDAESQFVVGAMYFNGEGVPKDNTEASAWFRKAAAQGNSSAIDALARISRTKTTESIGANSAPVNDNSVSKNTTEITAEMAITIVADSYTTDTKTLRDSLASIEALNRGFKEYLEKQKAAWQIENPVSSWSAIKMDTQFWEVSYTLISSGIEGGRIKNTYYWLLDVAQMRIKPLTLSSYICMHQDKLEDIVKGPLGKLGPDKYDFFPWFNIKDKKIIPTEADDLGQSINTGTQAAKYRAAVAAHAPERQKDEARADALIREMRKEEVCLKDRTANSKKCFLAKRLVVGLYGELSVEEQAAFLSRRGMSIRDAYQAAKELDEYYHLCDCY